MLGVKEYPSPRRLMYFNGEIRVVPFQKVGINMYQCKRNDLLGVSCLVIS